MNSKTSYQLIKHLINISDAKGSKRIFYSIFDIFFMALSGLFVYFTYYLIANHSAVFIEHGFLIWLFVWLGVIVCILSAFYTFIQGFVAQICVIISSSVSIKRNESRRANIVALIVSIFSLIAVAVVVVILVI